jgi:chromosome segregation and condensation protein ScpB
MTLRSGFRPVDVLDESEVNVVTLERLERRLGEECGQLRLDIAALRTEVADRGSDLMKWLLAFFVAQTAALATVMAIFR